MKKLVLVTLLFVIFVSACSKNVLSVNKNEITGTWLLKNISGGFAGINTKPTDRITITIEPNGSYSRTFNNDTTETGNYTMTKAPEPNYYYTDTVINLTSTNGNFTYGIDLRNGELFLSEGCCDQFDYTYTKLK